MGYTTQMEDNQREIIENLEKLNWEMHKQNSLRQRFMVGIVYGVGFFMGSAILATTLLGIFWPWIAQIPFIQNAFEAGGLLLQR